MIDITPDTIADLYLEAHTRVVDLVADLDDATAATPVPGTPEWTVHDLVAHLAAIPSDIVGGRLAGIPNSEQTQAQVDERRDRSIAELLAEWKSGLDPIVEGARAGLIPAPLAVDAITHEQDLRGAIGAPPVPDQTAVEFAATGFSLGLGRRLAGADLPPLRLTDPDTGFDVVAGKGDPAATVTAPAFEIFRAIAGRRSRDQVAAYAWEGDSAPYLDSFCVFGPLREQDLYDA
jgi:uncharacterized protein (TIGR03083 family)